MRGPADVRPVGGLRIGIDVARFGNDKTVITFRRGRVLLKQIKLAKLDITEVAGRARAEIVAYGERPEQIAVDTIGVGAGVADVMRGFFPDVIEKATGKRKPIVVDVNSSLRMDNGRDYNLRAFMWREMGDCLARCYRPLRQQCWIRFPGSGCAYAAHVLPRPTRPGETQQAAD